MGKVDLGLSEFGARNLKALPRFLQEMANNIKNSNGVKLNTAAIIPTSVNGNSSNEKLFHKENNYVDGK
jgi:hypothetical protein